MIVEHRVVHCGSGKSHSPVVEQEVVLQDNGDVGSVGRMRIADAVFSVETTCGKKLGRV